MDENNMMQNFMAAMGVMYDFSVILDKKKSYVNTYFILNYV